MAVIKPSMDFEGSELNLSTNNTPYIKDGVRKIVFDKTTNQEGAFLCFLPAYKADSQGRGAWYKKILVRDNFGAKFKEKYFVESRDSDPAEYFASNYKYLYPEQFKDDNTGYEEKHGIKFKKYPACGRITERVLYNVAYANQTKMLEGAHVLDLPLRSGADSLMNWLEGKDFNGNRRRPINDPDRTFPVFVQKKDKVVPPWVIQVDTNNPMQLPEGLVDSDVLYNLDEVLVIRNPQDTLEKLREMYPSDVFDDCMNGFPGLIKSSAAKPQFGKPVSAPSSSRFQQAQAEQAEERPTRSFERAAMEAPKPAMQMEFPKASVPSAAPKEFPKASIPSAVPVSAPPVADIESLPANPMSLNRLSKEQAMRFISED